MWDVVLPVAPKPVTGTDQAPQEQDAARPRLQLVQANKDDDIFIPPTFRPNPTATPGVRLPPPEEPARSGTNGLTPGQSSVRDRLQARFPGAEFEVVAANAGTTAAPDRVNMLRVRLPSGAIPGYDNRVTMFIPPNYRPNPSGDKAHFFLHGIFLAPNIEAGVFARNNFAALAARSRSPHPLIVPESADGNRTHVNAFLNTRSGFDHFVSGVGDALDTRISGGSIAAHSNGGVIIDPILRTSQFATRGIDVYHLDDGLHADNRAHYERLRSDERVLAHGGRVVSVARDGWGASNDASVAFHLRHVLIGEGRTTSQQRLDYLNGVLSSGRPLPHTWDYTTRYYPSDHATTPNLPERPPVHEIPAIRTLPTSSLVEVGVPFGTNHWHVVDTMDALMGRFRRR
jgi:hypothetical protein